MIGDQLSAVGLQVGHQRVRDRLRAAARIGPAVVRVRVRREEQTRRRGAQGRHRGVRVRQYPRQQRVRLFRGERPPPEAGAELEDAQAVVHGGHRMPRHPQQL